MSINNKKCKHTQTHTQRRFYGNSLLVYEDYAPLHSHMFGALCPSTLYRAASFKATPVQLLSQSPIINKTFLEKGHNCAKVWHKWLSNITVCLSSMLPIRGALKALANWSSAFIRHKSYICNWAFVLYLSSPLPLRSPSCFIWVHNHNGLSNGSKMPFPWTKSLLWRVMQGWLWDPYNLNRHLTNSSLSPFLQIVEPFGHTVPTI